MGVPPVTPPPPEPPGEQKPIPPTAEQKPSPTPPPSLSVFQRFKNWFIKTFFARFTTSYARKKQCQERILIATQSSRNDLPSQKQFLIHSIAQRLSPANPSTVSEAFQGFSVFELHTIEKSLKEGKLSPKKVLRDLQNKTLDFSSLFDRELSILKQSLHHLSAEDLALLEMLSNYPGGKALLQSAVLTKQPLSTLLPPILAAYRNNKDSLNPLLEKWHEIVLLTGERFSLQDHFNFLQGFIQKATPDFIKQFLTFIQETQNLQAQRPTVHICPPGKEDPFVSEFISPLKEASATLDCRVIIDFISIIENSTIINNSQVFQNQITSKLPTESHLGGRILPLRDVYGYRNSASLKVEFNNSNHSHLEDSDEEIDYHGGLDIIFSDPRTQEKHSFRIPFPFQGRMTHKEVCQKLQLLDAYIVSENPDAETSPYAEKCQRLGLTQEEIASQKKEFSGFLDGAFHALGKAVADFNTWTDQKGKVHPRRSLSSSSTAMRGAIRDPLEAAAEGHVFQTPEGLSLLPSEAFDTKSPLTSSLIRGTASFSSQEKEKIYQLCSDMQQKLPLEQAEELEPLPVNIPMHFPDEETIIQEGAMQLRFSPLTVDNITYLQLETTFSFGEGEEKVSYTRTTLYRQKEFTPAHLESDLLLAKSAFIREKSQPESK